MRRFLYSVLRQLPRDVHLVLGSGIGAVENETTGLPQTRIARYQLAMPKMVTDLTLKPLSAKPIESQDTCIFVTPSNRHNKSLSLLTRCYLEHPTVPVLSSIKYLHATSTLAGNSYGSYHHSSSSSSIFSCAIRACRIPETHSLHSVKPILGPRSRTRPQKLT